MNQDLHYKRKNMYVNIVEQYTSLKHKPRIKLIVDVH